MQTTRSNYVSLAFFMALTIATVALYTFSFHSPENKGTPVMFATVTSLLALITCPSTTTVYLNGIYNNYLSINGVRFYGNVESLEYFKGEAGEFLRGVVLFLYVFMGGSVIVNSYKAISFSLITAIAFAFLSYSYIKRFKDYLINNSENLDL